VAVRRLRASIWKEKIQPKNGWHFEKIYATPTTWVCISMQSFVSLQSGIWKIIIVRAYGWQKHGIWHLARE
jgi:hypothetical protein